MKYKVIITTSGTGSRLGSLTKNTNKALVPLAGRPAIDYVLDRYDTVIPIVITLGYLVAQVKDYLTDKYKNRTFEFVEVNPYEGPGSSLGFSLLQACLNLQCPFIFHACDTIVLDEIPSPELNWAGCFLPPAGTDINQYRTHQIYSLPLPEEELKGVGVKLSGINEKGAVDYAPIHIGLTGIKDFSVFWQTLERLQQLRSSDDTSLSDVHVVHEMIQSGFTFRSVPFPTWLDTGNMAALRRAEQYLNRDSQKK